jgi:F-type H+-transporting ATPase subunit delta
VKEEVIAKRYAKALIGLGQEQGTWEEIGRDLGGFVSLFQGNEEMRRVLCDPIHDRKKRKAILQRILERAGLGKTCSNFLLLLVDKERIRFLPAIYHAYQQLEDTIAGRLRARVVTAHALAQDQVQAIEKALEQRFNKTILLDWEEDPEILGGAICRVDGMVFDGSIRSQLEILKESMKGE